MIYNGDVEWSILAPISLNRYFLRRQSSQSVDSLILFPRNKSNATPPYINNGKYAHGPFSNGSYYVTYPFMPSIYEINKNNQLTKYHIIYPIDNSIQFTNTQFDKTENYLNFVNNNDSKIFNYSFLYNYNNKLIFEPRNTRKYQFKYILDLKSYNLINLSLTIPTLPLPIFQQRNMVSTPFCLDDEGAYIYSVLPIEAFTYYPNLDKKEKITQEILKNNNAVLIKIKLKSEI